MFAYSFVNLIVTKKKYLLQDEVNDSCMHDPSTIYDCQEQVIKASFGHAEVLYILFFITKNHISIVPVFTSVSQPNFIQILETTSQ